MPNEQMRDHWTDHAGPRWVAAHDVFAAVFRPVAAAIVEAARPLSGRTVLDVGCGTGALSAAVASAGGQPIGVDISSTMIAEARRRFAGLRFDVADVQDADLEALAGVRVDVVVSEFGVMFFDDPVAAFANLRAATASDGRLAFACWRALDENPMFSLGTSVLVERLPEPPPIALPGRPGPGAFADPDRLTAVLERAGWSDVDLAAVDVPLRFGGAGSDGVEERVAVVLAGSIGAAAAQQLRPVLGNDDWERLLDDVRADVRGGIVDGQVQFPGRTWIVTASR